MPHVFTTTKSIMDPHYDAASEATARSFPATVENDQPRNNPRSVAEYSEKKKGKKLRRRGTVQRPVTFCESVEWCSYIVLVVVVIYKLGMVYVPRSTETTATVTTTEIRPSWWTVHLMAGKLGALKLLFPWICCLTCTEGRGRRS